MRVEIIQRGRVLRSYNHEGQVYVEAPSKGDYEIRLTNNNPNSRLAVLSVDGMNTINGEEAGFEGPGYVLAPWQSITVKGWLRSNSEVAKFTFRPQEGSYAAQSGQGTKNTGVIGVAVFEEKEKPEPFTITNEHHHHHHHHHRDWWWHSPFVYGSSTFSTNTGGGTRTSSIMSHSVGSTTSGGHEGSPMTDMTPRSVETASAAPQTRNVSKRRRKSKGVQSAAAPDLGTGYGSKATMHTAECEFERASKSPDVVLTLRYAVKAKLKEWGVPVADGSAASAPQAFPASDNKYTTAPAGWNG